MHALTFYIMNYATKKQVQSSNVLALLAQTVAFHLEHGKQETDTQRLNKLLLQCCANSLTRDREFSAPEIISYLMRWGDRFESHYYVMIFWELAVKVLLNTFPSLSISDLYGPQVHTQVCQIQCFNFLDAEDTKIKYQDTDMMISAKTGSLQLCNQLGDYQFRGLALEDMNFFSFMLDTYETFNIHGKENSADDEENGPKRGRPPHEWIPYLDGA